MRDEIRNDYFGWLYNKVCGRRYSERISYRKLLMLLHSINFRYSIPMDGNRADDGVNLRYRYTIEQGFVNHYESTIAYLDFPCTVLEMMVALAIKCEENIMDDPSIGDRTAQWFWGMVVNLGLGSMTDEKYDKIEATRIIDRFLDRGYEPNGQGGLFMIRNTNVDLRTVEIWHQLCWYLDSIT